MLLNAAFLLIGLFVTTLSVDIPFLAQITNSEVGRRDPKEIFDEVKAPEPLSDEYPIDESAQETEYELPSFSEEYRVESHIPRRSVRTRPDYQYEDLNAKESAAFEEEWYNTGVMEISFIGRLDPSFNENRRRRDTAWKKNTLHKRDVQKAFSKTVGCNRLPVAPAHAFGTCHHNDAIGKCWVRCHKFSRYPNEARQRELKCQKGLWRPRKLPDCVQQTLCEEIEISGNNMYVSCISENEETKCTGTCEDGFTFPDNETVKVVECEELDGEFVTHTKFPDCSFSGNTPYNSTNTTEEPTNDTWIYV